MISGDVIEYVVARVLGDFRKNRLSGDLARSLSRRPWIDTIRDKGDDTCLARIEVVLSAPREHEGLVLKPAQSSS